MPCFIAVSPTGFGTGLTEDEAMRNLVLADGSIRFAEVYYSSTLGRGACWVDDEKFICWQGAENHGSPTLVAKIIEGKRVTIENGQPVADPPKGYVQTMLDRRKASSKQGQ